MLNLNKFPYFDDSDEAVAKGYNRILFKPGYAVQARELTQLQTILQEQIRRFGDNIFKDGTVITGCAESYNFTFPYVKILNTPSASSTNWTPAQLQALVGSEFQGVNSLVRGIVKYVQDGSETDSVNLKTLYIQYTASGGAGSGSNVLGTVSTFQPGEALQLLVNGVPASGSRPVVSTVPNATGFGSVFTVDSGIVYASGVFVLHNSQTTIIDKYSSTPSAKLGYRLVETAESYQNDPTLLDPAQGSFNYTAPGADRYKIVTELVTYDLDATTPQDFFLLFEIEDGLIRRKFNKTTYGELRKEMARRTRDESGDYTVRPFALNIREHLKNTVNNGKYPLPTGDATKLAVGVEPGKAYVQGFEYETYITETVAVDKGTDTSVISNKPISTYYGSYVEIIEVAGPWNLNTGAFVSLLNTAPTAVTSATYSATTAPSGGAIIGTARVRMILYESGSVGAAAAVYKLHLYDITMNAGHAFSEVLGVYALVGGIAAFGKLSPAGQIQEAGIEPMLFPVPYNGVKTLQPTGAYDTTFQYRKEVVASFTAGTAVITLGANEQFAFSGTITAGQFAANVYATAEEDIGTLHKGQSIDFTSGTRTAVFDSTTGALKLSHETSISTGTSAGKNIRVAVNVVRVNPAPKTKSLLTSRFVKIDTSTHGTPSGPWTLGVSDVLGIEKIWLVDGATVTTGTFAALAAEPTGSPYLDVTDQFVLNGGQSDSLYNHGTLALKAGSTIVLTNKRILVKLSYYSHSTASNSVGYFSVDSYPVNDTSPSSSQIYTWQIPRYVARSGQVFDLRNTLDFRARITDTATTTTVAAATVNPATSTAPLTTGMMDPVPTEEFVTDLSYYLGRIDRIMLTSEGNFVVVRGVSRDEPLVPQEIPSAMSIGLVNVPPYPSLSPFVARMTGYINEGAWSSTLDNRRYTMRDIAAIGKRIDRLEYYTSLSLLEQETSNLLIDSPTAPGVDRFKNGILVDSFNDHTIGNVYDSEYLCSIDPKLGELRPYFNLDHIDLALNSSTGLVRKASDAIITLAGLVGNEGDTIVSTSGPAASGTVRHRVGTKLHVENIVGSFSDLQAVTVGGIASTVSGTPIVSLSGDLLMLPYTHGIYARNPFASKPRNCVGALLFDYVGNIVLDPPQDIWTDVTRAPDVNTDGGTDNWDNRQDSWSTEWGAWETIWVGVDIETLNMPPIVAPIPVASPILTGSLPGAFGMLTPSSPLIDMIPTHIDFLPDVPVAQDRVITTSTSHQSRTGIQTSVSSQTTYQNSGSRVLSTALLPYMRSIVVSFTATRLKPLTRMYAFFDGEDVTAFCRPTKDQAGATISAPAYGAPMIADATGKLVGEFRIPAGKFRTGTKTFSVVDDSQNRPGFIHSSGITMFTASGLSTVEQNTIVATRVPVVSQQTVTETRDVADIVFNNTFPVDLGPFGQFTNQDPIAQTFLVSGKSAGMFVSKIDLYFRKKAVTAPITVEIREVSNGVPTGRTVPFGSVTLLPSEINADDTATNATPCVFPAPVYLKNDTEYCFVVMPAGNSDEYELWVSELGENMLGTTTRITEQPATGVLFVSANNSSWTPIQAEDVKFTLYQAVFNTASSGTAVLNNAPYDFLSVTMTGNSADFVPGEVIATTTTNQNGRIKYVARYKTALILQVEKLSPSSVPFVAGSALTATSLISGSADSVKTATVVALVTRPYNTLTPNVGVLNFVGTAVDWSATPTLTGGSAGTALAVRVGQSTDLHAECSVYPASTTLSTFNLTGVLSSTNSDVSPVIDLKKAGVILVSNSINDVDTNETAAAGGSALSRYISRKVVLDAGMDAEDLRVYLTQSTPAGTTIEVYAKLLHASDPTSFLARPWILLDPQSSSTETPAEVIYELPSSVLTSGVYTYSSYSGYKTFAIKIVLLSNNTSLVPKVRDMRAISLMA
jgi:hypothetical protein